MQFHPEGHLIDTFENRAALQTPASLAEAMRDQTILEAKAIMCDSKHNLIVDLKFMRGLIPREEGAIGIKDGSVRDIAILSRVNRPVCFWCRTLSGMNTGALRRCSLAGPPRKSAGKNLSANSPPAM